MLWDDASRAFVRADPGTTRLDDPCLRGLTIEPGEVIARINKAMGKGGRLDLAGIGLRRVPAEVWQLEDLADLQLSNNELVGLPEDIANLTKLERLGLAGNRLRALPEGVGRLARLEGLWAHGNVLGALPESIGGCESLRVLMLAGNRLRALPDAIGNLEDLEELSVPGNALRALPETVGRCRSLRSLDAHGNQIGPTVPASIADLAALEDLAVQGNRIEALPDGLSAMRRLRRLNVAENDLAALPERLGDAAMLTTLWCYANPRLARLPESLAANLSLKAVWAEACGLDGDRLGAFARDAEGARKTPPATLGLDEDAARRAGLRPKPKPHILKKREEDLDAPGSSVGSLPLGGAPLACDVAHARVSSIGVVSSWLAGGSKERPRGYFKLQRWRGGSDADVDASPPPPPPPPPSPRAPPCSSSRSGAPPGFLTGAVCSASSATTSRVGARITSAARVRTRRRRCARRRRASTCCTSRTRAARGTAGTGAIPGGAGLGARCAGAPRSRRWRATTIACFTWATPWARPRRFCSRTSRTRRSRFVRRWICSPRRFGPGGAARGCGATGTRRSTRSRGPW